MAYQGRERKPSALVRSEGFSFPRLDAKSALSFPFLVEGCGGGFRSLAGVENHPDGDAVAGYGVEGGLGGEGDHCVEVLCRLRRCTNYGIPGRGRQPSAVSAQITVQTIGSS